MMGYRPEGEDLEGPVEKIIEGIIDFRKASFSRKSGDSGWGESHLRELTEIENVLNDIELNLRFLLR